MKLLGGCIPRISSVIFMLKHHILVGFVMMEAQLSLYCSLITIMA